MAQQKEAQGQSHPLTGRSKKLALPMEGGYPSNSRFVPDAESIDLCP